jgi:hypothetical protein
VFSLFFFCKSGFYLLSAVQPLVTLSFSGAFAPYVLSEVPCVSEPLVQPQNFYLLYIIADGRSRYHCDLSLVHMIIVFGTSTGLSFA